MDISRIERFELKDNDIVIVRVQGLWTNEQKTKVEDTWSSTFERQGFNNIKVIALNETVGLQIVSKKD